jgi:hypothetical protein
MRNYEKMNKTDLRAACKAAGISYGKMSVAEMREALTARAVPVVTTPAPVAAPVVPHPVVAAASKPVVSKPAKVQRAQRNGVTRPGPGKCLAVWEAMEALHAKTGNVPTAKDASDWATANKANVSNATQELSRWRKFAGLAKSTKVAKEVQAQAA